MNAYALSVMLSGIIIALCLWATLTHKVRTNSLEIVALGTICIASIISIWEVHCGSAIHFSQLAMRSGVAMYGLHYFIRTEILPHLRRGGKHATRT